MAIKKMLFKRIFFIALMLTAIFPCLFAQESAGETVPRLRQRFTWSGGEYALRYEVVFERIENGVNIFHLREFTENRFVEVTLRPGQYRFRVIPYDLLNRPAQGTEWRYIEVLRMPEQVFEAEPEFELKTEPEFVPEPESELEIEPVFEPESETQPESEMEFEPEIVAEPELVIEIKPELKPEPILEPKPELKLEPELKPEPELKSEPEPKPELKPESEPAIEQEPESETGKLKNIILSVGANYSVLIPYYGNDFETHSSMIGAGINFNIVFQVPANIYVGFDIRAFYNIGSQNILAAGVNLLAMKWISNERIAVGVRYGAFYPVLFTELDNIIVNAGASVHLRLLNNFVLEAGVDLLHVFNDVSSGSFRPWIGFAYQF